MCVKYNLVGCKKPILLSSQNTTIANPQFYSAWPLEARILLGQIGTKKVRNYSTKQIFVRDEKMLQKLYLDRLT